MQDKYSAVNKVCSTDLIQAWTAIITAWIQEESNA